MGDTRFKMVNQASILAARLQRILYRECMKCAVSDIKQNVCQTYTLVVYYFQNMDVIDGVS